MLQRFTLIPIIFMAAVLMTGISHASQPPEVELTATAHVYLPMIVGSGNGSNPPEPVSSPEQEVIELTNAERVANGCPPLTPNPQLAAAAEGHSEAMATQDFFNHVSPDGRTFADRVTGAGYAWSRVAENIAAGQHSPQAVVDAWMRSPGHRKNILNCNLSEIGVGYYHQTNDQNTVQLSNSVGGPYFHYWTQDLGTPR